MNTNRRRAVAALTAAGLLWGTTVPLSKLALGWLAPGWLTFVRFGLAAAILLAVAPRARVRAACTPSVLASGAIGYGGSVVVQNAGITRTSVSHAALLIGATPVLVAIIAALWHRTVARPVAWVGFAVSLGGVGLVAGGGGGGATAAGDGLVLASLLVSAAFTVAQARRLQGRDPVALTAVQFLGAALAVLPFSVAAEGVPALPAGPGVVLAVAGLAAGGTLLPFTLFAYAQGRVSAEVAGAFLNLEPLVGAVAGVALFGDPAGPVQLAGGVAILAGIALSSLPLLATGRRGPAQEEMRPGPGRPQPRQAQPRSPLSRGPSSRSPLSRGPSSRSPQPRILRCRILRPRSPQSQILRCRIPMPGDARHGRPPRYRSGNGRPPLPPGRRGVRQPFSLAAVPAPLGCSSGGRRGSRLRCRRTGWRRSGGSGSAASRRWRCGSASRSGAPLRCSPGSTPRARGWPTPTAR